MACGQELCPNWSGDGRVCPCAALGLPDWDDPESDVSIAEQMLPAGYEVLPEWVGALPEDEGTRQPDDPGSDAAVGRRLRDARVAAGLSLRDAAARLGIEARQLADVEHGRTTAPNWLLARVASEIAPMTEGDSDDRPLAAH